MEIKYIYLFEGGQCQFINFNIKNNIYERKENLFQFESLSRSKGSHYFQIERIAVSFKEKLTGVLSLRRSISEFRA